MKRYEQACLASDGILLPGKQADLEKWAVIACDQFTSDPAYWRDAQALVGDDPSALKVTLPEIYLSQAGTRTGQINAAMAQYLAQGLFEQVEGFVYVKRQTSTGLRRGLVCALDLEAYDYSAGSVSPVRATEGTILSRIPPRVAIRRDAPLELPHVMVLFDDPENTVFSLLAGQENTLPVLYDFDLMLGGGHICGLQVADERLCTALADALAALADPKVQAKKYGPKAKEHPLLFAVGDGNHSLATAKAVWAEKKAAGAAMDDPARFALVELVNLHDESLQFEPIHRLILGGDAKELGDAFEAWLTDNQGDGGEQQFEMRWKNHVRYFQTRHGFHALPVGTLQAFLDAYLDARPQLQIDYIHDDDALIDLAGQDGNIGFLLPPVSKDAFFAGVVQSGALPRKTFSMGISRDKRYYLEARKICR